MLKVKIGMIENKCSDRRIEDQPIDKPTNFPMVIGKFHFQKAFLKTWAKKEVGYRDTHAFKKIMSLSFLLQPSC